MRRIGLVAAVAIGVLAFQPPARAEQLPAGEPVPLYTNADLEKFGPPTAPDGPVRTPDGGEWRFVQEFLDREYARVDADRRHDLDRAVVDEYTAPPEPRYRLLSPYYGYSGYYGYRGYDGYPGYPRTYPYGVPAQDGRLHRAGNGTRAAGRLDAVDPSRWRHAPRAEPPRHPARPGNRHPGRYKD